MNSISKVLIANRGAIARRLVRACNDMELESVAVFSACDSKAPYLAEASEAYPLPGYTALDTYLNSTALLDVAARSGADAVHPGYGFLAENATFAQAVIDSGRVFIGPRPTWLEQMGDKVAARSLMQDQGFPMFAGSQLLRDPRQAAAQAEQIGYPVMVKPSGGGGGMGMTAVADAGALEAALHQAQTIGASAFGDSGVYIEKLIEAPRHIEFQILGDGRGGAMHVYERDCSVQRRNQKLIEETPAPGLDPLMLLASAEQAAEVCAGLGYDSLGTVETLVTPDGDMGFLEMNTRIQVEHGVTEMATGLDLVQAQMNLAEGGVLPALPERSGYAMEVRIYAEDSATMLPSTGVLQTFRPPCLHGVRVDTGYSENQAVTPYYDAMLAKVIATGETREMAIGRLLVALKAFEVRGVQTNAGLLSRILEHDEFLGGNIDTGILNRIIGGH